ncbi:MAG: hypothetical protein ABIN61_03950 [candidate division WOR-3 bacterium]
MKKTLLEVETLVDEVKWPGMYEVQFDGRGLSSGIYFYRLIGGDYISVRKMNLVK